MDYYATVECPRCQSTSQFKLTTIPNGPLFCPVCFEGDFESNTIPRNIIRYKDKILFEWKSPLTDYHAS
jgi:late competence protein required for DNA uptake (superfamily II DNA/RNA helicase)